jgi:hypothetical protein
MKKYAVQIVGEYTAETPHLGHMIAVLIADHEKAVEQLEQKVKELEALQEASNKLLDKRVDTLKWIYDAAKEQLTKESK